MVPYLLMKSNTNFTVFHVVHVKYVNFFASFNLTYYCCACVCQSSASWFILGAMSALGHVVFLVPFWKTRLNEQKLNNNNNNRKKLSNM